MKKVILALTLVALVAPVWGQGRSLSALFSYSTFYLPDGEQPYVESYLLFDASSLGFVKMENGRYRATVEVTMVYKSGDEIVYAKKYDLNSPTTASAEDNHFSFLDLQRVGLKNGIYNLELTLRDKSKDDGGTSLLQRVNVAYEKKKPSMSSLQLMATVTPTTTDNILSRGGYDMEPYIEDEIPANIDVLNVYYEVYNIKKEVFSKPFTSIAFVEERATGRRMPNVGSETQHEAKNLVRVYSPLDISQLPSGDYNLVVEIHNRNNDNLLYKRLPFHRTKPSVVNKDEPSMYLGTFASRITDENKLNYYLDALYPIASDEELAFVREVIKKNDNIDEKQAFLYKFWDKRYGDQAEVKWDEYRGWLEYVDAHYSYPRTKGYRTDRGRVYLQYGPPDYIRDEKNFVSTRYLDAGSAVHADLSNMGGSLGHVYYLPYQLWRYNYLPTDSPNRVFLFWDEFRSGYYRLLNSNAKGEIQEAMWERRLSQQQLPENAIGEVGEQFERGY